MRRADGGEFARRTNEATELLAGGVSVAQYPHQLATRFGCSTRQVRRCAEQASDEPIDIPDATTAFTAKLSKGVAGRVRAYAADHRLAISAVVAAALVEDLARTGTPGGHGDDCRAVETAFVFDRLAAADLSVAYGILVPQRRARIGSGRKGHAHDQRRDLRPGVVGPAEEGRYDRQPGGGAYHPRRSVEA